MFFIFAHISSCSFSCEGMTCIKVYKIVGMNLKFSLMLCGFIECNQLLILQKVNFFHVSKENSVAFTSLEHFPMINFSLNTVVKSYVNREIKFRSIISAQPSHFSLKIEMRRPYY